MQPDVLTWEEFKAQQYCRNCGSTVVWDKFFHSWKHEVTESMGCEPGSAELRPTIVTLCGSTKFQEDFLGVQRNLTLQGIIVVSVGLFGHMEGNFDFGTDDKPSPIKQDLDALHLRKIDLADAILVINKDDYIGTSTKREISYAVQTGKPVFFMEKHNDEAVLTGE